MATSTSSAALYGEGYEPRRLQPQNVRAVRLGRSLLGYRITEVAGFLDWVVTQLELRDRTEDFLRSRNKALDEENARLKEALNGWQPVPTRLACGLIKGPY